MLGRPFPTLNAVLPTLAATVVTVLATWFVADAANDGLLRVISPPLVAVLPGLALTIAAMELASGQMISGATRLIYGVAQLSCSSSVSGWGCMSAPDSPRSSRRRRWAGGRCTSP